MRGGEFGEFVFRIGDKVGFGGEGIIVGGDDVGGKWWEEENGDGGMEKWVEVVKEYVGGGLSKIDVDG